MPSGKRRWERRTGPRKEAPDVAASITTFFLTIGAYCFFAVLITVTVVILTTASWRPAEDKTLGTLSVAIVPLLLLGLGWIQGRFIFVTHLLACGLIWVAWRDPTRPSAEPNLTDAASVAMMSFMFCAAVAGFWNASLRWRAKELGLRIPFRRAPSSYPWPRPGESRW